VGFHDGELAVQRRAGVSAQAERLAGMLDAPDLGGGIGRFLAERTFAAITGRDGAGRLWISPVTGPPGFLEVAGSSTLRVRGGPGPGDPLHGIAAGQPVGLLAIEFARRRRVRVNGTLVGADQAGLTIEVDQAYGNCPQYIRPRILAPAADQPESPAGPTRRAAELGAGDIELIRRADTALLGTTHPERGNDASHRGGPPGFVRVLDGRTLWLPDYPGNNMFNSLGNLAVDPSAALLFVDFADGATVRLSGTARLDWATAEGGDDEAHDDNDDDVDGGTGRRVRFTVEAVATGPSIALRAKDVSADQFR
jgi:predicted pyridoxine 5'-phosphate oxidase superfamily flavin-nucleotide-binding protein